MIRLDTLTGLATAPGPFAVAYLDATQAKELGPQEVEKRWRALRGSLAEQGADEATLDEMQAAVGRHDVPGEHGQALVAPTVVSSATTRCRGGRAGRPPAGRRCRT